MLTLAAIAFDRFMAVFRPLYYSKNNSKMLFYIVCIIGVLGGTFTTGIAFAGTDSSVKISVCSAGAAISALSVPYSLAWSIFFTTSVFGKFIVTI